MIFVLVAICGGLLGALAVNVAAICAASVSLLICAEAGSVTGASGLQIAIALIFILQISYVVGGVAATEKPYS